ncbi:MAG: C4-dicarboxylate ABC transporter [Alphaproteobacteria bacterium]|nr:C4-dicarboxylate ABC transporter [Alphaproteobacteria bacterium]
MSGLKRRDFVIGATAAATASSLGARAQAAKPKFRFSAAFTDQDIRAEAYKALGDAMKDDFDYEPHLANTLFRQGTELVALQRGNLEMCNLSPADISRQVPSWSLLTSAYLFRDSDHLKKTFQSAAGQEMIKEVKDKIGIHLVAPVFFGTRQVNLKPGKKIATPADMTGMKLRMPPGEAWAFLGQSIGANPTPVAFAEVYTALQTGAIDGQDNPLVLSRTMKFHEVTSQFVLTGHVVGYDMCAVAAKSWDGLSAAQRAKFAAAAEKAFDACAAKYNAQEQDAVAFFKAQGKEVYAPDVGAFRSFAQKKYLESEMAKDWPKGMIERINAIR